MCNVKSLADDVPLKDKNGKTHWIVAYSRHKISAYIGFIAVSGVINLFPFEFDEEDVSRPHGEVDVLVLFTQGWYITIIIWYLMRIYLGSALVVYILV